MQGRTYVADDAGRVCDWAGTDGKGCCAVPLEPCAGCDTVRARTLAHTPALSASHACALAAAQLDRCADAFPHALALRTQESKCCSEFEFCVSCCQGSAAVTSGAWKTANVIGGRSETGVVADAFDFCRGKCRTNPKSTVRHAAPRGAAPASRCC